MAAKKESILTRIYFATDGAGAGDGTEAPRAIIRNATLFEIQANWIIQGIDIVVTAVLEGIEDIIIGDDSVEDGFCLSSDIDPSAVGVYKGTGSLIATTAKYYAEADNLSLYFTGTPTSGSFILVLKGYEV